MPISVTVLSAALVEGALTFVVQHARSRNLPVFQSNDFDGPARKWQMADLVKSAARGGAAAILDDNARLRADWLNNARQRIQAGRMISDHPSGAPDYRRESAREAKSVADLIVRKVLDWLASNPLP